MKLIQVIILASALWASSLLNVQAAITIERIEIDGHPPVLLVKGDFEKTDNPDILEREAALTKARIVSFNSNGGNIIAAIAFGRKIRALGLNTLQLRSSQCASACALAFVGGVIRNAEPGAIGVHQTSFEPDLQINGKDAAAAVQSITAEILMYFIEMGVDPKLLQISLSVNSSDMRYLTTTEMETFKVTTPGLAIDGVASVPLPSQDLTQGNVVTPNNDASTASKLESALAFMEKFHAAWSQSNSSALTFLNAAYSDTVVFYGKPVSRDQVLEDKQTFAERWPIRAYSVKFGSETASCPDLCEINGLVEWFAASPARNKMSSGVADFTLIWNPVSGMIESENGKVIRTDRKPKGPIRIIDQWNAENGRCRGGSGDDPKTLEACGRREVLSSRLEAVGWCYGRPGEYGYQNDWHVCGM